MIYVIGEKRTGTVKIGKANDPRKRLHTLQIGSPRRFQLQGIFPGDLAEEKELHLTFRHLRVHGEWFNFRSRDSVTLVERELARPPLPLWPDQRSRMSRDELRAAALKTLTARANSSGLVDFATAELAETLQAPKSSVQQVLRELVKATELGVLWMGGNRCITNTARYRVVSIAPKQTWTELTAHWEKQLRRDEITIEQFRQKIQDARR